MTGQDLRNSILQLAIQGKLVEQREEEGTARELIAEIKAEKERLVKEKKIKKEKPLPEISEDEIPFDIPESWEWVRVIDISDMYTGNSIPKRVKEEKYTNLETGYEYIATKDVGFDYVIDYDNGVRIPFDEVKFRKAYRDSTLMCIEGGSAGRKLGILDRTVCFGNKLCSFNPIMVKPLYLYYYLQSPVFIQEFNSMLTGIIGGVGINKLKTTIFALPPLDEQKRIVEKIEELMPYIDKYGETHIKLEDLNKNFPTDMQKSILQYAIQGKLVEQREEEGSAEELYKEIQEKKEKLIKEGKIRRTKTLAEISEDEIPFDIPESWEWARLEDIIYTIGSKKNQIKQKEILEHGKFPVISQSKNIIEGYYSDDTKLLEIPNTVIVCGDHSRTLKIIDFNFIIGADGTKIFVPLIIEPDFLFYALEYNIINIPDGGYSRHYKYLKDKLIPLPPLEEQKRIVEKIEELLPLCSQLKQSVCKV